jgi:hypothetical protein
LPAIAAERPQQWLKLNEKAVGLTLERVHFSLPGDCPKLQKIRFHVEGSAIWIYAVQAFYQSSRCQTERIRLRILDGEATPDIAVVQPDAGLSETVLAIGQLPYSDEKVLLSLWGLPAAAQA